MLLANYASDSDSDQEDAGPSRPTPLTTSMGGGGGASKPKRKAPVKITLDLPKTTSTESGGEAEAEEEEEREFKKSKTGTGPKGGKGSSALLGMLPPPKRKLPASKSGPSTNKPTIAVPKVALPKPAANLPAPPGFSKEDSDSEDEGMVPPSLRRKGVAGKGKGASVDLFGLGDEPSASSSSSKPKPKSTSSMPMSISSAPTVADFIPPQPTANDPYPGYYQTPSGEWAAYDQDYYHTFFPAQTQEELEQGDGRVGRHWEEFNSKGADFIDIDVSKGLEEARIERERKALAVKPKLPGDEVEYKAVGQIKGLATERHQLSSLLNTAFTQKEELEQRITSNKKNMRVAAQKYGF